MWAQSLAIALVVAGGVASLVMAVGSLNSLEETRIAYYERLQFADVFAMARRAPKTLLPEIAEIPGVAAAEGRIIRLALLDIPEFAEPATENSSPCLRCCSAFSPHARAKKLARAAECLVYSLTPSGFLGGKPPKNRGFVGILRGQKCLKRGQKCLRMDLPRFRGEVRAWD